MMKSFVLEDFLDFEEHFIEYIRNTWFFRSIKKAIFLVFDDSFTEITYRHSYHCDSSFSIEDIHNMLITSEVILEKGNAEVRRIRQKPYNCDVNRFMINVHNPIDDEKRVLGSLLICSEKDEVPSNVEIFNIHYLEQLLYHIQNVITNYDKLYHVIDMFTEMIITKDHFMPYHMTNVAQLCISISSYLEISHKDITILYYSALLHDIGKLFIPDAIINKQGALTNDEYARIQAHSNKGSEILLATLHGMTLLREVPHIIRHHHENYDGTGYPDNLVGSEIPYLSRILRVVDTVDAMSSKRAYKDSESLDSIVNELAKCRGTQFDPIVVSAMIELLLDENSITKHDQIEANVFVPQASLSFYYKPWEKYISLQGNLVVKKDRGTFILHDPDKTTFYTSEMYKATISYLDQKDLIEHRVNIATCVDGSYIIKDIVRLPTDKTFSMLWHGKTQIINRSTGVIKKVEIFKLGGDTVVIKLGVNEGRSIRDHMGEGYEIELKEAIKDFKLELTLDLKLVKYYRVENSLFFICCFVGIQPGEKDKLLRLLFRAQIENKRSILKIKRGQRSINND